MKNKDKDNKNQTDHEDFERKMPILYPEVSISPDSSSSEDDYSIPKPDLSKEIYLNEKSNVKKYNKQPNRSNRKKGVQRMHKNKDNGTISFEQKKALKKYFKNNPTPIITETTLLAKKLGLRRSTISSWLDRERSRQVEKKSETIRICATTPVPSKDIKSLTLEEIRRLWKKCTNNLDNIVQSSIEDAILCAMLNLETLQLQECLDCRNCFLNPAQVIEINCLKAQLINHHVNSLELEQENPSLTNDLDSLLSPWCTLLLLAEFSELSVKETVLQISDDESFEWQFSEKIDMNFKDGTSKLIECSNNNE